MHNESKKLPNILLCGYERGGTTLLSDIFRSNGYESGFECGVLMCDSPSEFSNYQPYMDMLSNWWGISEDEASALCRGDFKEFYTKLIQLSFPSVNDRTKFFDKTPIYMSKLGKALNQTDFINKACVIHRDPRSIFVSWAKRVGKGAKIETTVLENLQTFCKRYLNYFIGCIAHINNPNVMFIPFEDLCLREDFYYKAIGMFSDGYPFSPRASESRFNNVSGKSMDLNKIFEFDKYLSSKTQKKILDATKLASMFFASSIEQVSYGEYWQEKKAKISSILQNYEIVSSSSIVDDIYFEPITYLLLYPDVLKAKVNPIAHFKNHGILEKRRPC